MSNTLSKPTGALNRVVAHNSDDETGGMEANHDVVNENILRLEDLEHIFSDENLFFEVQSLKKAANATVNETHNQQHPPANARTFSYTCMFCNKQS